MKPIVTFFGTQPYEQESFDALNRDFGFEFRYFKGHLSCQTVVATHGAQAACIFVNDTADAEVMRELARNGVRLLGEFFRGGACTDSEKTAATCTVRSELAGTE